MKPKSATIKAIASLLAVPALGAALPAQASTFTVGGSGSNFTITRLGDTSAAETVHYRTVPLSAFPGQHYMEKSGTLVFAPGQTGTNITVSAASMSNDAYRFQTGTSRSYRFELTDRAGALLASKDGSVSSGLTQVSQNYVSSNITDLVKFNGSSLTSGMGSSKYYDVSYSPSSNGNHVMTDGYIKIDDGYDYDNHTLCTIPTSAFFTQTKGSQDYFDSLGCKLYATVYFTMKEVDDGYQYIQILADNATSKDGKDPDGGVNTPSTSIYKACFELSKGSGNYPGTVTTDHYQAFPHRTDNHTSSTEFDYADAYLYAQAFKDNTPSYRAAKSGSLVLSPKVNAVNVRFDANGGGDDTWLVKNLKVRFALCDSTRPTKLADPVVAPGPYRYGTTFYVSIPFREIVTVTGTPTLHTDWGDLSYFFGSGSNVLTFKGVIDADYGENLVVRTLSGTITDLAGNALATPLSVYKEFSCTVDYPWAGSGTEAYPYVITTTNQLGYLAARVNAAYGDDDFAGKYFVLAADLDYGGTSDWDGYPDNTSGNNFTPVGCFGRSFKGHFDGQGHTVSGIRLDKHGADEDERSSVGLFGFVSGGSVRNIVLRDSKFQGDRNVGGIVGYLSGGTVTNCTLYHVLAGTMCVGRSSSVGAGIVVGHDDGTVSDCHYRDCRVGTTYQEEIELPGSAGSAFPRVHNDRVDNVFAVAADAGVAVTPATVDGVVIDGASYYAAGSTFDLSYSGAVPANWSVVYAPTGGAAVNGDTLVLAAADATVTASVAPPAAYAAHWQAGADHDGTGDKPYVITTPEGLQMLSAEVNAGTGFSGTYFRLGADIDMSAVANFMPIGQNALNKRFAGNFDGDGQTISGLSVNTNGNHVGLFGYVTGSVANLTLCGATITGEDYVGGIVGVLYSSDARLTGCRVVGSVVTATLATDKVPQTGAIVGGGVIVSSATGNTYHSTIVRAPNATGGDFHADGDAFNVGVGSYYALLPRYGDIGPSGATLDPSCLLLPTNAPAVRAALIAAYADPAAHTAHGGATPDLSGLVVTSGVTRLYAVTNCTPVGLSVSGTDVVLAGLGRSYFAPGDAVALVPPAGFAIVAASYTDASGTHAIEPAAALAYAFPMPDSDVSVAATLAATSGYCGRADANGGENVVWNFDPATGALAVGTNAAAVGTDFAMADYTWSGSANTPWAALRPYIRSISIAPGVVSVGDDAFYGCTALATVTGGANVTRVGARAFGNLSGSDDYTTPWLRAQPAGVAYLGKVAIAFKSASGTDVEIAAGTVSIAECAFNSSPVTSIVLPESVAHIGKQAFGMCDYLAAVYLLSAAPPALDDPDYLFTVEGDEQSNPDLRFYVRGAAYADAWSGVWGWMENHSDWTDANRIVIGAVSCSDGITASGTPVLACGGTNYYAAGSAIALGGVPPAPNPVPAGYITEFAGYDVNGRPVDGASFTMPERDATVTPRWAVVDFEVGHTGTEQDPYVIYNKDQLDLLAARVNGGKNYSGKFIRLGADIAYDPTALDENGENYTAIGDYNHEFLGNFDGDGHTVRGIRINKTGDSDADEYQGLFGCVCDGTIRNVTLADSVVIGYRYVGGVVGYQYLGDAIANCRVESDVILGAGCDGADFCGGIVGYTFASVRVRGCLSAATVTDRGKSVCDYYGGIVGWCSSPNDDVQDCLVLGGTVAARGKLGAIAGKKNNEGSFTNNYYAACTVNGTTNATNVGCGDPAGDIDGARYAHTITLGPGVRIVGEEMVYSVSGLTAIGTSALRYTGGGTNVIYGGAGQTVTLAYDGVVAEGYLLSYAVNGAAIDGDTFTMPDADVTVTVNFLTPWEGLQAEVNAANGGTVVLNRNYVITNVFESTLTVTNAVTLDLHGHTLDARGRFGVIEILPGGHLTLTNSVPETGSITGGNATYGGGVHVARDGTFTMSGGTIATNGARLGGGVYVVEGGWFEMSGGEISGNTGGVYVDYHAAFTMVGGTISGNTGGVFVKDGGELTVSGSPVISGNTNSLGVADNVYLYEDCVIAISNLTVGASIGVTTKVAPTADSPVTIATGAAAGHSAYFFSDDFACHVEQENGDVRLVYGIAYPTYLGDADDTIRANYLAWAAKYGPDTASAYESCFLLGVDPAAVPTALGGSSSISPTGSLLRVVQFNATTKGFHLELASDYTSLFQPLDPDGDPDPTLLGNGFAAIELATDPAVFASTQTLKPSNPQTLPQLVTMPVPVSIDAATGRATVDFDIDSFLKLLVDSGEIPPEALGFITAKMPSPLFIRPAITTIYPDDYTDFIYLLVAEP